MYTTKRVNGLTKSMTGQPVGFLAAGNGEKKEPYQENFDKNPRYKGKQFTTIPPRKTADGGDFGKRTYTPEEYSDRLKYITTQPLEARKLGFGSHNAKNRDEFTLHIRTEQYREQLKTEKAHLHMTEPPPAEESAAGAAELWETSSREVGAAAAAIELQKPKYGRVAVTKEFNDRGHL